MTDVPGKEVHDADAGSADERLHVHVHLGHGFDAARYRERYERGESIEYTPYDFHLAERPGVAIAFSSDGDRPPAGRVAQILNRRLHFAIDHAWHNRGPLRRCDVVWTMSESETFAVAALMAARIIPRRPIIGTAIWLFNNWPTLPQHARALFRRLSRHISVLTVHSAACLDIAADAGLDCAVELSPFGINDQAYPPLAPRDADVDAPIHVLAAGNDWTRDWATLLAALGNDERFVVSAWSRVLGTDDQRRFRNLRLPKPAGLPAIRQMYADADVVVVPMIANVYSGITVALEAAAQQRAVISTATGGVPTYLSSTEARFVAPGDPDALRAAVLEARQPSFAAMTERAYARFVADDYTTRGMVERYLRLTRRVLAERPPLVAVR